MGRKNKKLKLKDSIVSTKKNKCKAFEFNSTRNSKNITIENTILIYCNSLETEINYFNGFKKVINDLEISEIKVDVIPTQKKGGKDPYYAVNYAINNKENCKETWVVFDKDEFDIENAIKLAEENNINVAWSNECFELWLLLHFNFIDTAMDRKVSLHKLKELFKKKFGIDYDKNDKEIYSVLKQNIKMAISNAKKQHQIVKRDCRSPNRSNPCTTVYKLVEKLTVAMKL